MSRLLDQINQPSDLRELSESDLTQVASELRDNIIQTVSQTGGHLAANLGVVELTIALLRVFNPPNDKLVWDVSHQTYAYKMLTGRRDQMYTLRQYDGISGFSKRDESPYDAFGAGHAGTAISAAVGMAVARDRRGSDEHVVAIVGDASAGNGISLEALNSLSDATRRLIVILNDNEMSISENVGAMSRYLGQLLAEPRYNRLKRTIENFGKRLHLEGARDAYYRVEEAIKGLFLRGVIFEEFGLRYVGPIDGHDLRLLTGALTIARESDRPIVLHVSTRKGQGYPYAEEQPVKWHGTVRFDIASGKTVKKVAGRGWSKAFGDAMLAMAEDDDKITAITAAMAVGTGLTAFAERFPKQFFDVGISEEHGAVFAAGMAAEGLRPYFALYSTFSQRIVDCVIHDICLQKLPVVLCFDRAGVVGDDGPTHHGVFDIPLFRCVPDLVFMQPADEAEFLGMLKLSRQLDGPSAIRYPRGTTPAESFEKVVTPEVGRAQVRREGKDVWLWAIGDRVVLAEQVADLLKDKGVEAGVVNARFITPLDRDLLCKQATGARLIVTFENGVIAGGFGSGVQEALSEAGIVTPVLLTGWPNAFVPHGAVSILEEKHGQTAEAITAQVLGRLG